MNTCSLRDWIQLNTSDINALLFSICAPAGVILLSPYIGPVGPEEFLQFLLKEAGPSHLLSQPMSSSPLIRLSPNTGSPSAPGNGFFEQALAGSEAL